jgi:hypothetical protein
MMLLPLLILLPNNQPLLLFNLLLLPPLPPDNAQDPHATPLQPKVELPNDGPATTPGEMVKLLGIYYFDDALT